MTRLLGAPEQLAKRRRLAQAFCQEAESKDGRREEEPQLCAEISLRDLAARGTSFCVIGVALAWWTVAGVTSPCNPSFTDSLIEGWLVKAVARFQSTQRRERGVTFPIRLGELEGLKDALLSVSFDTALSPKFVDLWCRSAWLFLCIAALNDLAGTVPLPLGGGWSAAELRAVGSLQKAVDRRCRQGGLSFETSESAWQKEMSSKRVGYSGEEISTCQELSWDQVVAALPPEEHGACIDTLEWVSPRTREFLLDPSRLLKDPQTVVLPKMPGRIHVKAGDKMKIAVELVKRRICDWIPLEKVYKIRGTPILNGLFGVGKPSFLQDGRQILRLIMNLTGSNATQEQLTGGCVGLPSIMSWQSIVLEENQGLSLFQSDMRSAFYLFRLPGMWKPHLCFNLLASGLDLGFSDSRQFALCCNVIPMGWLNSVGIMQEISENLMRWGGMNLGSMVSRNKLLPPWMNCVVDEAREQEKPWFHVYLDNFAAGERLFPDSSTERGQLCHETAEAAWAAAGVISSEKKRVTAASTIGELGAEVNGNTQTLGISTPKLTKVIQATLWLLVQRYMNRKHVQILAGRWVFILQFRRPGMAMLNDTWKFISGKSPITAALRLKVKQEFMNLVFGSCLWHCNLGAAVSNKIVATDASEHGGAVGYAEELTTVGQNFLEMSTLSEKDCLDSTIPVMVLSLFNGIGGAFRCYDVLGLLPVIRIAVEKDAGANRVTTRRWPGTVVISDVAEVNRELVRSWARQYLNIEEIHLWAGFPCVDLSRAKFGRENLWGEQSSLFWHIPRIKTLLAEEFGHTVKIRWVCENVASMDRAAAEEISYELECAPYQVDSVQAVPMRRPRFSWTSEQLENVFPDVWLEDRAYWKEVMAYADYPAVTQWITPGYTWNGESEGSCFPTCMKAIARSRPPPRPAGLEKCDQATISRWKEDSYRYPPYQYAWKHLLTTSSTWRLFNEEEKEVLLGYGIGHTKSCWAASKAKQDPQGFSDARHSYLGDSFSIFSFILLAFACCRRWLPHIPYRHLVSRMGLAPGFRAPLRVTAELGRTLNYGNCPPMFNGESKMEIFNRMLLRRTNHTGSDVRVASGEVFNSRTFPRQSVESVWWDWKHGFAKRWSRKAHINVLELEAILLGVKFQLQRFKLSDARIYQVTDSYVCMSVVSKGRSSSLQLTRVLKQIAAHLLAYGLFLVIAHVDSSDNPTDAMSRQV